jgi:membrane protein
MASKLRKFWNILVDAGMEFVDDNASKLSASLAYYTLFSIGPLLLVIITLLGFFYKKAYITAQIFDRMRSIVGANATSQLQSILVNMSHQTNKTLIGIIGILVFIFGATGIFSEIQGSINYIWSIKAKPKRSWLKYITDRLLSLVLVIGLGFLMLVTVFINILIDLVSGRLKPLLGANDTIMLKAANLGLLFLVVTLVFTIIFKVLPDAWIHWKDALIGAVLTAVLFIIGKFLISYYLGVSKSINLYGAATSIILLLSWVYYSSMILYYGAAFTEVYAHIYGKGITVNDNAVHISKQEIKTRTLKKNIHPEEG